MRKGQPVDSLLNRRGIMSQKMFEDLSLFYRKDGTEGKYTDPYHQMSMFQTPFALVDELVAWISPADDFSTWLVNRLDGNFPHS